MNIFVVDRDPVKAAQSLVDKHVVKMPLETAQMLCTTQHMLREDTSGIHYKPCFQNHPCTKWARLSKANYLWLIEHGIALCQEYTHRYGKRHACQTIIENASHDAVALIGDLTPFAQAMPNECKQTDAVEAYRAYYNIHKRHLFNWTRREQPSWIKG